MEVVVVALKIPKKKKMKSNHGTKRHKRHLEAITDYSAL